MHRCPEKILIAVTHSLGNVFPQLDEHDKESEIIFSDLHSTQLTKKKIVELYIKIRLYSYEKQFNKDKLHKKNTGLRQ